MSLFPSYVNGTLFMFISPDWMCTQEEGILIMEQYDVIVIGAGVVGSAIARELSRYEQKTAVLE